VNEILHHPGVPREDDGTTAVIDSVTECGPHGRVIDLERRDLQPVLLKGDPFVDVLDEEQDAVGRARSTHRGSRRGYGSRYRRRRMRNR